MTVKNVFEPGAMVAIKNEEHAFAGVPGRIESIHDMIDGTKCAKISYPVLASLGPTMGYRDVQRDGVTAKAPEGQENTDKPRLAESTLTRHSFFVRLADLRPCAS